LDIIFTSSVFQGVLTDQARNQLGTLGVAKSFLRGGQLF